MKNKLKTGMLVRFDPLEHIHSFGVSDYSGHYITGTIVFVNDLHKWFLVEYGYPRNRLSFKFCDIGGTVKICGH